MTRSAFALFVDVMGTQHDLAPTSDRRAALSSFERSRDRLEAFHQDLSDTIGQQMPILLSGRANVPQPSFVAEFSDSAYIVGEQFGSVAIPGLSLMRRALRHKYPLRGGIGVGSFSHETSGVRTIREGQVWTTSSFFGGAIVTAYQAERSKAPGLRILVHPLVLRRNTEAFLKAYTIPLLENENSEASTHELRIWRANEAAAAISKLREFRDMQNLPEGASRHYEAAINSYARFGAIRRELPHVLPALWLDGSG